MNTQDIIQIFSYFIIYSFLGWVLESIAKSIIERRLVNSGFLFGPFCPIYGFAACIMYLGLARLEGQYIKTFIISFFAFSAWEYFVGWLLEKCFDTKYWDYSCYKLQIKGRVCLINSLIWGFLAIGFVEIIHPFVSAIFTTIPEYIRNPLTITLSICMATDFILTFIKVKIINTKLETFEDLTKTIKDKLEELKKLSKVAGEKAKNSEHLNKAILELKQTQYELKESIEKRMKRLRGAFPNMTSDKIAKFLKQKIEFTKERFFEPEEKKKKKNMDK